MNNVILIGRLTKDPELRYIPATGRAVTSFTIAVDREFRGSNGERQADFFNVVVWGKQAENVANHLEKGRQVAVDGRIENRSYENDKGEKKYITEIIANKVEFLGGRGNGQSGGGAGGYRELEDDNVPF